MTKLSDYAARYRCLHMERDGGVLVLRLHTDGGPFFFDEPTHHQLGEAFAAVADDPGNKVVVLTGTGDQFCAGADPASFAAARSAGQDAYWMRLRRDGDRMLRSFVDIEVPVIAVVNGPVAAHSELPLLADVVLAADDVRFSDDTHFLGGLPPGDGMHIVWTALVGINRARYFLMTGQRIEADEALRLGLVGEVLPRPALFPRALEIAGTWAALPDLTRRNTRALLNQPWRRALAAELYSGLSLEAMASLSRRPAALGSPGAPDGPAGQGE